MTSNIGWYPDKTYSKYSVLTLSPKYQPAEVGEYTLQLETCLPLFPTVCFNKSLSVVITDCIVTSLRVVWEPALAELNNQYYALSSAT